VHDREVTDTDRATPDVHVDHARHALWLKLAVGVLFAVLGTVLLVKVVGGSSGPRTTTALSKTSASVLHDVTTIPEATYDAVGVRSVVVPVVPPSLRRGAHRYAVRSSSGAMLPLVLFVGAEFNSFSASERWPLVAALSRFGTFHTLYDVESSSIDFAPNTPTFSFYDVDYDSAYLELGAYEIASDVYGSRGYERLMLLPQRVRTIESHLDPTRTLPFVDVANLAVARQAGLSPVTFDGLSRDQIAGALADPTNPVTQSIVASANYLTAAICHADHEHPAAVCASPGVRAADAALRIAAPR
jgi:Domain of unknown function (DUF929)